MSIPVPRGCSPVAREPFYHGRDCDPFSRLRATECFPIRPEATRRFNDFYLEHG